MKFVYTSGNEGDSLQGKFVRNLTDLLRKENISPFDRKSWNSPRGRYLTSMVPAGPPGLTPIPAEYYSDEDSDNDNDNNNKNDDGQDSEPDTDSPKKLSPEPSTAKKRQQKRLEYGAGKGGNKKAGNKKRQESRRGGQVKRKKKLAGKETSKDRSPELKRTPISKCRWCGGGGGARHKQKPTFSKRSLLKKSKTFLVNKLKEAGL